MNANKYQQVNRVLKITLVLNLMVALGKITLGIVTGAIAITADGFHSLADTASNVVGIVANTIALKEPDEQHPYGHKRFETLATLGIGMLLLLTAWETIQGIAEKLFDHQPPNLPPIAFVVMIATLIVNIIVNRYEHAQGKRLNSSLLIADAAHTGADILVTLSVLVGMTITTLTGWYWVDILVALVVVGLILKTSWSIIQQAGSVLVDTAPYTPDELIQAVQPLPTSQILRARSRGTNQYAYIDLEVQIPSDFTAQQTASVAHTIETQLRQALNGIEEVEVRFTPLPKSDKDYISAINEIAQAIGLNAHNIHIHQINNTAILDLHVEVADTQTLDQAHRHVSLFEREILRRLPDIKDVVTHIEPIPAHSAPETAQPAHNPAFRQHLLELLNTSYSQAFWNQLHIHKTPSGVTVAVNAQLPAQMSIRDAHILAEDAERLLRAHFNMLDRITIHTEPAPQDETHA